MEISFRAVRLAWKFRSLFQGKFDSLSTTYNWIQKEKKKKKLIPQRLLKLKEGR